MPKPTVGQSTWGQTLNDHLDALDVTNPASPAATAMSEAIDADVATSAGLAQAGQVAVSESSRILRSADDERATLTPDGRTRATIMTGAATGQTYIAVNCTASDDTTRFKEGTQSKRFTTAGAVTAQPILDPLFDAPAADPFVHDPASLVKMWLWLDDVTKISSVELGISQDAALAVEWLRPATMSSLRTGWNLLTWAAHAGTITNWGTIYRARLVVVTTGATAFNIGAAWLECPPKAQVLFINDGGYETFVAAGLPDLRSRNIPVTWALTPARFGMFAGTKNEIISSADVDTFYAAGDDVSLHSNSSLVTSTMTPTELRDDTLAALKTIQDEGWDRGRTFRPAFTQNLATNHAAVQPYFAAYATYNDSGGQETWPFVDKWNVSRVALHGRTTGEIDGYFANLQTTRGLLVCYTHGIHADGLTNGGADMTPAEWTYFLGKIDAGIAGGWLEGTSFSKLLARSGGVLRA